MGAEMLQEGTDPPWAETEAHQGTGPYLYCVADSPEKAVLGRIGLGGAAVYTKPRWDICAVVHRCIVKPYRSNDQQVVKGWMLTHQRVVETAWGRCGTVLPFNFNTIFQGVDDGDVGQRVEEWLEAEYHNLRAKIEKVMGRAEYGVQVSWDPAIIGHRLTQSDGELEREATRCFQDLYGRIRKHVDDLRVERTRSWEKGRHMILNISCLASREQILDMAWALDDISKMDGFSVGLTGPWPPYSFVGNP